MQTMIGRVTHYYPKIVVAAVVLENHISRGDNLHIHGPHDALYQKVTSMELEHVQIQQADAGLNIGIKVLERVHESDIVIREN